MTDKEILNLIQKQLVKYCKTKSPITEKTQFKDLQLDSLTVMELVIDLETHLEIRFPDEKLKSLQTIGDLINLIKATKNTASSV